MKKEKQLDMGATSYLTNLDLYMQPFYDIQSDRVVGAEVLVRKTSDSKVEPADKIISTLRELKIVDKFDIKAVKRVCEYKAWKKIGIDRINVNLSVDTLDNLDAVSEIISIIKENNAEDNIVLEINEDSNFNSKATNDNLRKIYENNIRVALDDFNANRTWVEVMNNFDVYEIKYRCDGNLTPRQMQVLHALHIMAEDMHTQLIVECIRTHEELDKLRNLGIKTSQSYITGKPEYLVSLIENAV